MNAKFIFYKIHNIEKKIPPKEMCEKKSKNNSKNGGTILFKCIFNFLFCHYLNAFL